MKKLIFLALIIAFFSTGCKSEKAKNQPESKATETIDTTSLKPIEVQKSVSLKYDLKKNTTLRFRYTNYQKNIQTLQLDSTITGYVEQNVDYVFKLTVKDRESNGNLVVDFYCESIKANASSSEGEKLSYNSENPPKDSLEILKTKNFDILNQAEFSARVSPTGEVLDIFKSDKIIEKILSGATRKPTTEERFAIKNDIEQGILKTIVQQIFRLLPDKEVNVDSSWTQSYPTQISVFELQNTATYKVTKFFESNGNKLVQIEGNLSVTSTGQTEHTENNIIYKFQKPKVSGVSKGFFDLGKNCFRNVTSDVSFELVLNMQQKGNPKTYKRIDKILTKSNLVLLD